MNGLRFYGPYSTAVISVNAKLKSSSLSSRVRIEPKNVNVSTRDVKETLSNRIDLKAIITVVLVPNLQQTATLISLQSSSLLAHIVGVGRDRILDGVRQALGNVIMSIDWIILGLLVLAARL